MKNILKKKQSFKIPKTVQQSIPYESVYTNGVIETSSGCFSKSYHFDDANFQAQDKEKQNSMLESYGKFLNKLPHNVVAQITFYNQSVDMDEVKNNILLKPKNDGHFDLRNDINNILLQRISEGQNNLKKEKVLTLTVENTDIESVGHAFQTLEPEISESFAALNKTGIKPLTLTERLEMLYGIYNCDEALRFMDKAKDYIDGDGNFKLAELNKNGISSKDLIGPDSITVKGNHLMLGDNVYARTLFLDDMPAFLNTNILMDLTDMPCNMICSVIHRTLPQKKALKYVRKQFIQYNVDVAKAEKQATKNGYSTDVISSELRRSKKEAEELLADVVSRNQKIFFTTIVMTVFANSLEELQQMTNRMKTKADDYVCQARALDGQQMKAFSTALPLGRMDIGIDRILTTESASVFYPFDMITLNDKNGFPYGVNEITGNLIKINRGELKNPNGLILGQAGSGKSLIAKWEMLLALLNTDDDIMVIDPEREFVPIAEMMGGQVIHVSSGTNTFMNPLDMDIDYAATEDKQGDPVAMKCDFLTAFCETIVGKHIGLTAYDINVIHRCGKRIYEGYMQYMEEAQKNGITCNTNASPTLVDLYAQLQQQPEPEARRLAAALEQYCVGSYDIFAHRTNVDTHARLIVYDTKDLGAGSKETAMFVCMNDIWNRTIANWRKHKATRIYLDELHLLTKTENSIAMLQEYYKRGRKWNAYFTSITQDAEDLLMIQEGRGIFNNSSFVIMMNQSEIGRMHLAEQFHISRSMLKYITDQSAGIGLIYNGSAVVPFENKLPKDSLIYKICSTKPSDRQKE